GFGGLPLPVAGRGAGASWNSIWSTPNASARATTAGLVGATLTTSGPARLFDRSSGRSRGGEGQGCPGPGRQPGPPRPRHRQGLIPRGGRRRGGGAAAVLEWGERGGKAGDAGPAQAGSRGRAAGDGAGKERAGAARRAGAGGSR